jgi:cell division protease FtsH
VFTPVVKREPREVWLSSEQRSVHDRGPVLSPLEREAQEREAQEREAQEREATGHEAPILPPLPHLPESTQ